MQLLRHAEKLGILPYNTSSEGVKDQLENQS